MSIEDDFLKAVLSSQTANRFPPSDTSIPTQNIYNYINVTVNGTPTFTGRGDQGKMKTFVVLTPTEDGYFVAECPALPGCISQGSTKEEAIENIKEAIELSLEVRREMGLREFEEVIEVEV